MLRKYVPMIMLIVLTQLCLYHYFTDKIGSFVLQHKAISHAKMLAHDDLITVLKLVNEEKLTVEISGKSYKLTSTMSYIDDYLVFARHYTGAEKQQVCALVQPKKLNNQLEDDSLAFNHTGVADLLTHCGVKS